MALIDVPFYDSDAGGPTPPGEPRVGGFPMGTIDLTFGVHKSVSVYYAALRSAKRYADSDAVVDAHQQGVHWALSYLNREAAWVRNSGTAVPQKQLAAALAAEPNADPERLAQLEWQVHTGQHQGSESYDATTGLFAVLLTHIASEQTTRRKDGGAHPHIHTHVFVLPYASTRNGQRHPLDFKTLERETHAAAATHNRNFLETLVQRFPVRFESRTGHRDRVLAGIPDQWIAVYPHARCSMRSPSGMSLARQILVTTPPELCHWLGTENAGEVEDAAALVPRL